MALNILFQKLEELRRLPDQKKRAVALGGAFGITLVIFIFWAVSLSVTLSGAGRDSSAEGGVATVQSVSPFAALEANVSAAFAPLGNAVSSFVSYLSPATSSPAVAGTSAVSMPVSTAHGAVPAAVPVTQGSMTTTSDTPDGQFVPLTGPLIPGDSGLPVMTLQHVLTAQGFYTGPINSKFGPMTEKALANFQAKHGIVGLDQPGSGLVGPKTRDVINSLLQ